MFEDTNFKMEFLVSQGKRIFALACAYLRRAWFQDWSLFYQVNIHFQLQSKTVVLQGLKPPFSITVGNI